MRIFNQLESNVRSYCRLFPTVFKKAQGAVLEDKEGIKYIDFLSGVGTLNYGHNNPQLKERLLSYLDSDGIVHSLDLATVAKEEFLEAFEAIILKPRQLNYKVQFPGPTGTNAVEAALKLTRNITGRETVIAFSNGYHGVTLGSLATTANISQRDAAGITTAGVTFIPYDGYLGSDIDTTEYLDKVLSDRGSGVALPAAVIVETIQGAGGVNVASFEWLRSLETVCRKHDVLLVVDDIQVGCGRTGSFFSFEEVGISPDIVTISKSLSGFGLPFSLVLIKPELDQWKPGQHSGTFRGPNLAFVTAKAALEIYWQDESLSASVRQKGTIMQLRLEQIAKNNWEAGFSVRGRGMIQGLDCKDGNLANKIIRTAFANGLIMETAGAQGQVIRCLPPLTISEEVLEKGLDILENSVNQVIQETVSKKLVDLGASV
ncbi:MULTISPECIES: diaminobutyrate--2-oxoglutarate transaminase [unclassified Moorena]|uniref:diaminobutyrate--2-oxoglutarate transaminase n=1 Tax=unclassified Moorena TaxID=2683338 RepID=UPI001400C2E0|nr:MULTISPECIES: diaminobutyrate--2-oxoglutarate transaminase [unclassified Moorena]NEO13585.1 diaminobutyrate--2-oxoglutarate transaminase [Moorena sp. SIO3E8]NEP99949.1 diaminobutyrate--2-oxoglutarate transaminase [Moorena sp. SIO3F7]